MKKYFFFALVLLAVSCKDNVETLAAVEDKINEKTIVELAAVTQKNTAVPIFAIGRLGSDTELKMSFKIGGVIASMSADEGQRVKKGQVLASLRSDEIDAQVMKANQALEKAKRDLARIEQMFAEKAATLENVQDLKTLVQVSEADLEIARFNQKYASIVSPVSGRVIRRLAEPNELVNPGQPLFLLASNEGKAFVLKIALSDKDISRVGYGDQASVSFDAFPGETMEGRIGLIAESSDPRTGTFEVEVNVKAKGKRLRNGYIGRVEISPKNIAPYYTIPMAALVEADDKTCTIFIPQNNNTLAKEIQVEPFAIGDDYIAIKNPELDEFTQVITTGAPYLIDGDSIRTKP